MILLLIITVGVFLGITLARGHANNPEMSIRIRRGIGNAIVYIVFALFALYFIHPQAFEAVQ
jgi:hypothetical protein